ncbi:MAG: hemolysin family protein [Treponema sp.]|jgi:CBS domain containing-hemolysin-like protein|nr:hemolysin family protein [Treponema sp.]
MHHSRSYYISIIAVLVILLSLSAFFAACEMSFSSVNRIRLKNLATKSKRAALALRLLEIYDELLSTVLIGNNIVNIAASALATLLSVQLFGPKGVSVAAAIMTVLIVLFTDISPKALAKESPERTAINVSPLLRFFVFIFTPFNYLSAHWKRFITRVFPAKQERGVTEDELLTFVEEVRQEGGINKQEEEMIRQAIEFDDIKVSGIFTPRIDVAAVPLSASVEEIDAKFTETGYSRLPVFKESIDNITGIILFKDFYHKVLKGLTTPEEIVQPVVFITKTIKIAKLLRTLQEKQSHMAIVVDEHGGTLGIVTIEDIVEELVGEIWDEHDEVVEPVRKLEDGNYTVLGNINFQDMLDAVGCEYADDDKEIPDTTLANWIMENLGRVPRPGEKVAWRHLTITASKVLRHRVTETKIIIGDKTNV